MSTLPPPGEPQPGMEPRTLRVCIQGSEHSATTPITALRSFLFVLFVLVTTPITALRTFLFVLFVLVTTPITALRTFLFVLFLLFTTPITALRTFLFVLFVLVTTPITALRTFLFVLFLLFTTSITALRTFLFVLFLLDCTVRVVHDLCQCTLCVMQDLCQCTDSVDVNQAINRCLCKDFLAQPSSWWQSLWTVGSDPNMSPTLYERLVARFCGPATTVDVPTACPPRVVVRTLGQAVAETGLRFASLALTPPQVDLLSRFPRHLYLQGPPGCGKTIVLFLAALQSAQRGTKVAIVHRPRDVAVATLLKEQLTSILGATAAATSVHLHPCAFGGGLDVSADVASLRQQLGSDVHIIIDEVPWLFRGDAPHFIPWVTEVGNTWPQAVLWMAGLLIRDNTALHQSYCLPPWVEVAPLREPLRCPPHVTAEVEQYGGGAIDDRDIPRYVSPPHPVHTDGPHVRRLQHRDQPGHTGGDYGYLHCERCADNVADIIRELRVGQPGHPQYRDVWVLAGVDCPAPRVGDVFVQRLQHKLHMPVRVVQTPLSDHDARELALAVTDHIVITHCTAVQGLERRVVIVLGGIFLSTSRSTSYLCTIK